jgi:surface protein
MSLMFNQCNSLTDLKAKFITKEVNDLYKIFGGCTYITNIDLSGFDTSKVTDMCFMFQGDTNLKSLD